MCLVKATMGHDHLSHTPMAVISPNINFPITFQPHFCVTSWSLPPVPVECSQNLPKGGGKGENSHYYYRNRAVAVFMLKLFYK